MCLNGEWDFCQSTEAEPGEYNEKIIVPFPPESPASGIERAVLPEHYIHYRKIFKVPECFDGKRIFLHFGAVDQTCTVYLNGHKLGSHEGGYLPFSFDITDNLIEGENEISLTARDTLDHKYPYGKQKYKRGGMWYTPVSGIWQTVWLESVPAEFVRELNVTIDEKGAFICVDGVTDGVVTVVTPDGEVTCALRNGETRVDLPNPRLWCPEDPYLYEYTVTTATDEVKSYFAIRTLDTRMVNGVPRMCLNGKPIFFHAVLDQGYWSDGLFTPPLPTC